MSEIDEDFMRRARDVSRNTMMVDTSLDCVIFENAVDVTQTPIGGVPVVYPRLTVKNRAFYYGDDLIPIFSGYQLTKAGAILFMLAFHECILVNRTETLKRLEGLIDIGYGNIVSRGKDYCFSNIFDSGVNVRDEYWFLFANKMKQHYGELVVPKDFRALRRFDQVGCSKAMVYLIHMCDLANRLGYADMKKLYETLEFNDVGICSSSF